MGVITLSTPASLKANPWAKTRVFLNDKVMGWVGKDGAPDDSRHGLTAAAMDPAAAGPLFEGSGKSVAQVMAEAASETTRPKGFALKASATIRAASQVRKFTSPEIIGLIEGSDPKLKSEYVVLMAHADHLGVSTPVNGDAIYNGALDNAAGVATLLEVARALKSPGHEPKRSVLLIANTGEEKGLLGADYFARYPTVPVVSIVAGIDLDMPMLLYDFTDVVAYGAGHSTLQAVFEAAGADMGVKVSPDPQPEQAIFVRSDHYALVKQGVPAVMLATGFANGGKAGWEGYFANTYHQPSDDMALPIRWKQGARFAEFNYRVVARLADQDSRPQWYAGDFFGDLYAPKAPKAKKPG